MTAPTQRERREAQRAAKLEDIEEQIAGGRLKIRTMTDAERARHAPRTPGEPRSTSTGRGRRPVG